MDTYECAELQVNEGRGWLDFHTTEPGLAEWVRARIEEALPGCKISGPGKELHSSEVLSGERNNLWVSKLEVRATDVLGWWIIRQLCHQGWEPFAATERESGIRSAKSYQFRKVRQR